jgi:cobalt-zinc-cadmium efflux system outer membrane protein
MYDVNGEEMIANIMVGIEVPIHDRNQGNILSAKAQVVKAAREIDRREQQLRRQMALEFQQYEIARAQVERYRTRILPSTNRTLELSRMAQEAQQFSSLQILTVQRTYTEANQQYVAALRDMWQSIASLEGLLLVDALAEPENGFEAVR